MNRASPVEMRKALEVVQVLKDAGIVKARIRLRQRLLNCDVRP